MADVQSQIILEPNNVQTAVDYWSKGDYMAWLELWCALIQQDKYTLAPAPLEDGGEIITFSGMAVLVNAAANNILSHRQALKAKVDEYEAYHGSDGDYEQFLAERERITCELCDYEERIRYLQDNMKTISHDHSKLCWKSVLAGKQVSLRALRGLPIARRRGLATEKNRPRSPRGEKPPVVDISPRGKQAAQCLFGMRNGAHERTVSAARHPLFEHNGGSAEPPKNLECDANPSWSLGSR